MPAIKAGNMKAAGPKQRLSYINIRLAELRDEMKRLNSERKPLREKIDAERAGKPPKA